MCLVVMLVAVLQTLVVPIIGTIGDQLGVGTTAVSWLITANLLAAATSTPVLARVADLYGKRRVLLGILLVVLVGSLLAALASSLPLLVAARVLQGFSYGLFPIGIAVLRDELAPGKLTGAMGLLSGTMGFGGCFGIVLAGVLVSDGSDFHRVFWLSAAVTLCALAGAALVIPSRPPTGSGTIDWIGVVGLSTGLVLVLLALAEGVRWGWGSPATIGCAAGGILVLIGWYLWERRAEHPVVAPRLVAARAVLPTHLAAVLIGMAMFAMFLGASFFVQAPRAAAGYGFGATVLEAALVYLLPGAVFGVLASAVSGRLVGRFTARRVLTAASAVGVAGFVLFALAHDHTWQVILAIVLVNTFVSLAFACLPSLIVAEVPPQDTGVANSINSIGRSVGSSISSALLATLLAAITVTGTDVPSETAFVVAFAFGAVTTALAGLLVALGNRPARGRQGVIPVWSSSTGASAPSKGPSEAPGRSADPVDDHAHARPPRGATAESRASSPALTCGRSAEN
ncbi:MFS transporter [Rhodococcus triatomae]|nr:MFS transporter [Rhodococcus triatomae]QNG25507.1 MFS transporter [Rhodococcus triatomae]